MEIKEKEKYNASVSANYFNDKNTKNRAYVNTLGVEFVLRYLADEGIDISGIYNIHSIKKILGELDIADIMLPNIHIDVRVVFDENAIFIPKSHFDYDILPDIYIVVKPENKYSNAEVLGFFEPKLINKNNANKDYYFIEKEKLTPASEIKNYIRNFNGNTAKTLSDNELADYETLIISFFDNNISEREKQQLIHELTKSQDLRNRFIEYENFETLSYKVMSENSIQKKEEEEPENISNEEFIDISEESIELPEEINLDIENEAVEEENIIAQEDEPVGLEELEDELNETISIDEPENILEAMDEDGLNIDDIEPLSENTEEEPLSDITDIMVEMPEHSEEDFEELPAEEITTVEKFEDSSQNISEDILSDNFTELDTLSEETIDNIEETGINLDEFEPVEEFNDNLAETEDTDILQEETPLESFTDVETLPEQSEEMFEELPSMETLPEDFNEISATPQDNNEEESFEINNFEEVQEQDQNEDEDLFSVIDDIIPDSIETEPEPAENIEDIPDISALTSEIIPDEDEEEEENVNINIDEQPAEQEASSESLDISDLISDDNSDLEMLYNENNPIEEQTDLQKESIPGIAFLQQNKLADKKVIITAALVLILTVSAFALVKNRNNKVSENPQNIPAEAPINETPVNDTDLTVDTPEIKEDLNNSEEVKKLAQEVKTDLQTNTTPQAYMTVNKLVWNVPDALSYNRNVQNYLRTAGKSIKLSLSADLLLATEFAYTNQVKIGLKVSNNGTVKDARIISGSGSTQIDNIVLQSVKDTLNVVKPPSNDINASEFNLNLIIYF